MCLNRIKHLQNIIRDRGLEGVLLLYSRDIFYYTGTAQPGCFIVLPDDYMLFIRRGYEYALQETDLDEKNVVSEKDIKKICQQMFPNAKKKIGTELDILTVKQSYSLNKALNHAELVDISIDILRQRAIKSPEEIKNIKKACSAIHAGHLSAVASLKAGISELEFAAIIENAQRLAGHEGTFFMRNHDFFMSRGPLTSGPNLRKTNGTIYTITGTGLSRALPAGPSQRIMKKGDLVLVDIPACVNGYHGDQSRTYATGHAPGNAMDLFNRLKQIADHVIHNLSPGMTTGEAYEMAVNHAEYLGVKNMFMAFENQPGAHFIGHGVGLELNEFPLLSKNSNVILKPGMVLAIEMHIMEPNGGSVLKIEDTILISNGRNQILTLSPRELVIV